MKDQLHNNRHSLCHLMTMAVLELYPDAGLGVGPVIEHGFYQDYDLPEPISDDVLPRLEKRMKEMIKEGIEFKQHDMSFENALAEYKDDPYKTELIEELKARGEKSVSFYRSGEFENLCKGPHVDSSREIIPNAFKLTSIAGSYWRGDEKRQMLTRIYGIAFNSKEELKAHIQMIAEAKKRDHRKLGKELGLFVFSDLVGKGLPLFTPKGAAIRRVLERFIVDEEIKRDYLHVVTPDIAKLALYEKSGHYPHYKDSMYAPIQIDDDQFMLRPMTCPHHYELFLSEPRSYRDLPMRIAELAKLYRYEQSGELSGLMRVRSFCLADAHIVCQDEKQAVEEVGEALDLIEFVAKKLGLAMGENYSYRLSLGDRDDTEKYYKNDEAWDKSEKLLREMLVERKCSFVEAEGEAAFYGPKIDIQMRNVLGNEDTAFTVQYDFCGPDRFELDYTASDGSKKRSVVVHRSSIGAIERIIAFLIEHYAGAFPLWVAPVQVRVASVAERHMEAVTKMVKELKYAGIRAEADIADTTVGSKIRHAAKMKVPYTIIFGDKEQDGEAFKIRVFGEDDEIEIAQGELAEHIKQESQKQMGD
jgi:threonyl-tRNA synthetase